MGKFLNILKIPNVKKQLLEINYLVKLKSNPTSILLNHIKKNQNNVVNDDDSLDNLINKLENKRNVIIAVDILINPNVKVYLIKKQENNNQIVADSSCHGCNSCDVVDGGDNCSCPGSGGTKLGVTCTGCHCKVTCNDNIEANQGCLWE